MAKKKGRSLGNILSLGMYQRDHSVSSCFRYREVYNVVCANT